MRTQIKAEIVAHSINEQGDELISVMATFPRIILSEINTHRMLSKNTSSSRAIPFNKMVESVQNDPFTPIAWQSKHSGMQGSEYLTGSSEIKLLENKWLEARDLVVQQATLLENSNVTKQLCNRLLEPFMWTTMLITGPKSGWENFFKLRCPQYTLNNDDIFKSKKDFKAFYKEATEVVENHLALPLFAEDADTVAWLKANKGQAEIHMMALAECIWDAVNESTPKQLKAGEWHIPFEDKMSDLDIDKVFKAGSGPMNRQEVRVKTSVAMAARTSYTVVGEEKEVNYEVLIGLHDKLLAQDPPHSSPMEHCSVCVSQEEYDISFKGQEKGWFRNYRGFKSYRQIVEENK